MWVTLTPPYTGPTLLSGVLASRRVWVPRFWSLRQGRVFDATRECTKSRGHGDVDGCKMNANQHDLVEDSKIVAPLRAVDSEGKRFGKRSLDPALKSATTLGLMTTFLDTQQPAFENPWIECSVQFFGRWHSSG